MKCWEGRGRIWSASGGRFRMKDLGDEVPKAVATRCKEVKRVG